ncbi:hypothetical protein BDZ91DRAFT_732635 [Kalaharituber pfeilii]|nr:hypothetical protein BDZ91DRAFT_732635 [Kalaharituber pfeilii]
MPLRPMRIRSSTTSTAICPARVAYARPLAARTSAPLVAAHALLTPAFGPLLASNAGTSPHRFFAPLECSPVNVRVHALPVLGMRSRLLYIAAIIYILRASPLFN